jgi:hypothetical protein
MPWVLVWVGLVLLKLAKSKRREDSPCRGDAYSHRLSYSCVRIAVVAAVWRWSWVVIDAAGKLRRDAKKTKRRRLNVLSSNEQSSRSRGSRWDIAKLDGRLHPARSTRSARDSGTGYTKSVPA